MGGGGQLSWHNGKAQYGLHPPMYRPNLSDELSSIAGDLALGIPKGGGSVSAPHPIMSNDGRGHVAPRPKVRPI